jgi:hypothetical protein
MIQKGERERNWAVYKLKMCPRMAGPLPGQQVKVGMANVEWMESFVWGSGVGESYSWRERIDITPLHSDGTHDCSMGKMSGQPDSWGGHPAWTLRKGLLGLCPHFFSCWWGGAGRGMVLDSIAWGLLWSFSPCSLLCGGWRDLWASVRCLTG